MIYKILATAWRSSKWTVGFVAYDTENPAKPGEWNSVVGCGWGMSEHVDAQRIAGYGAKIEWQLAHVLFPNLDITKHKYYDK